MGYSLTAFFDAAAKLAGICPDCGHIFRLNEARPYKLVPHQPTVLDQIDQQQARIDAAMDKLQQAELVLREAARNAGLANAKRRLRRIDAVFSRAKLDPHDVKLLFDPVDYVVFDGMSRGKLRRILLLSEDRGVSHAAAVQQSIASAVACRSYAFKTLRIAREGRCSVR